MKKDLILVVDDSATVIKFVSFTLRNRGYDVVTATDGMDAMEKLASCDDGVSMVITDLNMPNVDGYTLIETLRRDEKYSQVPIVILSSEEEEADKARGLEVGANSYLVKPFKSDALLSELDKHLGSHE